MPILRQNFIGILLNAHMLNLRTFYLSGRQIISIEKYENTYSSKWICSRDIVIEKHSEYSIGRKNLVICHQQKQQ